MQSQYHFIGIGGIGMSALARILLDDQCRVSGSDIQISHMVQLLQDRGATIAVGHSVENVNGRATVVYNSDIKEKNPELQAAHELDCRILHRSDLLKELTQGYKVLAVTGSHGKTSTSCLLAWVLQSAGWDPSYALGGVAVNMQSNGARGKGELFVVEADESDGSFLKCRPMGAIVTNIGNDHLSHWGSLLALKQAFKAFLSSVYRPDCLFICADDPHLKDMESNAVSYGFSPGCLLQGSNVRSEKGQMIFDICFDNQLYRDVHLPLMGRHMALNALAVFGLCLRLGLKDEQIRRAFLSFKGALRRMEKKIEGRGVVVYDDYAHHPTEVKATLQAARETFGQRRLIVAFQPHRYSRLRDCLQDFACAFDACDELWLTDLYAAGEPPLEGVSTEQLMNVMETRSNLPLRYVSRPLLVRNLAAYLRPHDVLICMGAGDISKAASELAEHLRLKPPKRHKLGLVMGGKNSEHEISLLSAANIIQGLDPDLYQVHTFGITKGGRWLFGENMMEKLQKLLTSREEKTVAFAPPVWQALMDCDLFFPVLHGPFGEDGTLSGFFATLDKPFIGCDHRACSICMDKGLLKKLLVFHGLPTLPFVEFTLQEWQQDRKNVVARIAQNLQFPLFIKPSHLGSSVGVRKVGSASELPAAIDVALSFDTQAIAEEGRHIREIEFAVLGNQEVRVMMPGEIETNGFVYDYSSKYGPDAAKTIIPADLPQEVASMGQEMAKQAYLAVGCTGLARVDMFLDETGKLWINEINPMPGFTDTSLYPVAAENGGLPLMRLLDELVIMALAQKRRQERCFRTWFSADEA